MKQVCCASCEDAGLSTNEAVLDQLDWSDLVDSTTSMNATEFAQIERNCDLFAFVRVSFRYLHGPCYLGKSYA